jgi:hypothetical protein
VTIINFQVKYGAKTCRTADYQLFEVLKKYHTLQQLLVEDGLEISVDIKLILLLSACTVWKCDVLSMFQRKILPPPSGIK